MRASVWLSIAAAVALVSVMASGLPPQAQWDFHAYHQAASAAARGDDPYRAVVKGPGDRTKRLSAVPQGRHLPFLYPPPTLVLFRPFTALSAESAARVFITVKIAMLAALLVLWSRLVLGAHADALFPFFCLLAFHCTLLRDLVTGNVSIVEQLLLWSAFVFYGRGQLPWFAVLVVAASAFKLSPLAFLLLLGLAPPGPARRRALVVSIALVGAGAVLVATSRWQESYLEALRAVEPTGGALNPSLAALLHATVGRWSARAASAAYVVCGTAAIVVAAYAAWRARAHARAASLTVPLACFTYAVAAPRMKDYSFLLLLVPAYVLLKSARTTQGAVALALLVTFQSSTAVLLDPTAVAAVNLVTQYGLYLAAVVLWVACVREISNATSS